MGRRILIRNREPADLGGASEQVEADGSAKGTVKYLYESDEV